MKKPTTCIVLLSMLLSFVLCAHAAGSETVVTFAATKGTANAGSTITLTLQANPAPEADVNCTVKCEAAGLEIPVTIPAGQSSADASVTIPRDTGSANLSFSIVAPEGCSTRGSYALRVYPAPRVVFYNPIVIGHPGDGRELSVRVECQNTMCVLSSNNVFELRNQHGQVLATRTWSNPSQPLYFRFLLTPDMLGKQILNVYLGDVCVTADNCLAFISDVSVRRLTTLNPSEPAMSVTIDCGAPSINTMEEARAILAVLEENGVTATFFMTGHFVNSAPEAAKMIRDAGHEIGNHTYSHPRMTQRNYRSAYQDLMRCTTVLEEVLGVTPRLYRPPFGDTNEKMTAIMRGEGMEEVMWTIDSHDWDYAFTHEMILERVTNDKVVPGAIILFHLDGFNCAETLATVIPYYQETLGLRCVPVTELMRLSGREVPPMPSDREALVYEVPIQE